MTCQDMLAGRWSARQLPNRCHTGPQGSGPGRGGTVFTQRCEAHYGFRVVLLPPPVCRGALRKAGLRGEIRPVFRRRHLVPVPAGASLAELNALIAAADAADDAG